MNGNWGKYLDVDLGSGRIDIVSLDERILRQYVGGSALGSKLLHDLVPPSADPFSSENALILATGPFQSTMFPGCGKFVAISKSPLTSSIMVSAAGASFGPRLKQSGFDVIVIRGKAASPCVLLVENGHVELREAHAVWGQDTFATHAYFSSQDSAFPRSTLCIGPAGERQVALACLVIDGHSFAGRGGLGAVMGSKHLKAVVVSGNQNPPIHDQRLLKELTRDSARKLSLKARDAYHRHGTALDVAFCESVGDLPIKYWSGETWEEGAKRIGAPYYTDHLSAKPNPCLACPIGCHRSISLATPTVTLKNVPGPEYESLGMLGSCCMVDDLDAIAVANDICNRLGLDTISTGAAIAFSMECNEKGLLEDLDTDGMSLSWGSADALIQMTEKIGLREGFGELFANGIRGAASAIGPAASSLPVEVKGIDFPAHDPRAYFSLALNYITSPQGASHLRGFPHVGEIGMLIPEAGYCKLTKKHTMEGKPELTVLFQDLAVVIDSLVDCCFMQIGGLSLSTTTRALNAITGWDADPLELLKVGERGFTLQRLINIRDGVHPDEDRLPLRMMQPSMHGPRSGIVPNDLQNALEKYYRLRNWSREGYPTAHTLENLGIHDTGIKDRGEG
jgi:aldehyde:ferredoxin oxidoreductase